MATSLLFQKKRGWQAAIDSGDLDAWPPLYAENTSYLTLLTLQAGSWMENVERVDNQIVSATLVYEAKTEAPLVTPPPLLKRLATNAALGTVSYGQTVRLEQVGVDWPPDNMQICARVAVTAVCGLEDSDLALNILLKEAFEDSPIRETVAGLLLEHVEHSEVAELARNILSDSRASTALTVKAACNLKDADTLMRMALDHNTLTLSQQKSLFNTLRTLDERQARALARTLLKNYSLAYTAELLEAIAPPHLEEDDTDTLSRIAQQHPDPNACMIAIGFLGALESPKAREALLTLLESCNMSHDMAVAEAAAVQLQRTGDPRIRQILRDHLIIRVLNVQLFAIRWLQQLGTLEDVEALMAIRDKRFTDSDLRDAAAAAIVAIQASAQGERGGFSLADDADQGAISITRTTEAGALSVAADTGEPRS